MAAANETHYGRAKEKHLKEPRRTLYTKSGWKNKGATRPIIALVERGGNIRTWHVAHADKFSVGGIVAANIARETQLHMDEGALYKAIG